jgi:hypothetical protein
MAAEIKIVLLCPRCQEGITSKTPLLKCPKCEYPLGAHVGSDKYVLPMTLTEQRAKLNSSDCDQLDVLINMDKDKMYSIVNDCLIVLETLPGKKCSLSDIRPVIEMALKIGAIAKAYDDFLRAGGKHTPSIIIKHNEQKQEKKNESTQENAGGKPPPAPIFENPN